MGTGRACYRAVARFYVTQKSEFPFHITARSINRANFAIPMDKMWSICCDYLFLAHIKHSLKIHSFVLMPNHFHLIARSEEFEIGKIMCEFMTNTSREINLISSKINQNWGGRHYKCLIETSHYLLNCYKYVYQNPVRAGLIIRAEDWKYSSLNGITGKSHLILPIEEDTILFNPMFNFSVLDWINQPIHKEDLEIMRKTLTRKTFKLSKTANNKPYRLENERI